MTAINRLFSYLLHLLEVEFREPMQPISKLRHEEDFHKKPRKLGRYSIHVLNKTFIIMSALSECHN